MNARNHFIMGAVAFCGLSALGAFMAEREHAEEEVKRAAAAALDAKKKAEAAPIVAMVVEATPERIAKGQQLYSSLGCVVCHSADGSVRIGPSLFDLYGKMEKLEDGRAVKVDEAYIKESMLKPTEKVVAGFVPTMPSFAGRVEDEDLNSVIAWIKSLK
jgi:cytochrome c2